MEKAEKNAQISEKYLQNWKKNWENIWHSNFSKQDGVNFQIFRQYKPRWGLLIKIFPKLKWTVYLHMNGYVVCESFLFFFSFWNTKPDELPFSIVTRALNISHYEWWSCDSVHMTTVITAVGTFIVILNSPQRILMTPRAFR